ncbi:MAG: ubiquinone biosynthesis regulatory protein kinase UbiB [Gammaproteobacteria bacterium]|nr:ubiquinone biosynthesis regulatory protein kinase UbiB [Gammaproteobacteria bacterium]
MRRFRLALRLLSIQRTLIRHGLEEFVWATHLFRPIGWIRRLIPRRARRDDLGVRVRRCLEDLGPIFVKFGQAVSTRRDLLPPDIADELAKLQDRVPPFSADIAVATVERALGASVEDVYAQFEREPLAAASIAQVHAAELKSGESVVVKVLRPGVHASVARDVELLYAVAGLAQRYSGDGRRLRPVEVVAEFEKTLADELDLMREAANASLLSRNFEGSDMLYVPEVYWDHCRSDVLTMERVSGVPISDMDELVARGTDIRRLAHNGVEIFFTQVFEHNFFHADMHPGNIFVDVENPDHPKYVAVDFGIVGSLSDSDQLYLAQNFVAFFNRDYRRVAKLHIDSGWVPASTRLAELETAVRAVCEPIFEKPLAEISFGLVLLRLFETARKFDMEIQPQLVLLQKTLLAIEGLGRQLYPELNLWETAQPVLEDWLRRRLSPRRHLERLIEQWPQISEDLVALPDVMHRLVRSVVEERQAPANEPSADANRSRRPTASFGQLALGSLLAVGGGAWLFAALAPAWAGWLALGAGLGLLAGASRRGP